MNDTKNHAKQKQLYLRIPKSYYLTSLPRYYTNAASMTPFCCLCLPSLMRKLAVKERGNQARLSVSSIKLIPFLNEDTKYDVDLCNWVYQIVYTRGFESEEDGDIKIVPMGDVSLFVLLIVLISFICDAD